VRPARAGRPIEAIRREKAIPHPCSEDLTGAQGFRPNVSLESKLALKGRALRTVDAPAGFHLGPQPSTGQETGLLVFVKDRASAKKHLGAIVESARADQLTWVAYPKAGQLGTDLNRDSLASLLVDAGAEPVTQVSIDEIWSALRFRPPKHG
jgi:hypothetical protein